MTWEDWVNSEYNTGGYIINASSIYSDSQYICHEDAIDGDLSSRVLVDEIITNKLYYLVSYEK